jgi:hypothetical protein
MATKTIKDEAMNLLLGVLLRDSYVLASKREGELGTLTADEPIKGLPAPFEEFIFHFFNKAATGSPYDPEAVNLFSEAQPLRVTMSSGINGGKIEFPSAVATLAGITSPLEFNLPDTNKAVRSVIEGIRVFPLDLFILNGALKDIRLFPSDPGGGSLTMEWNREAQGLVITIEPETRGKEVSGEINVDFDKLVLRLFMIPRLSAGRMLWDWAIMSFVSVARNQNFNQEFFSASHPDIEARIRSKFTAKDLNETEKKMLSEFKRTHQSKDNPFSTGGFASEDGPAAKEIAKQLGTLPAAFLIDNVELIGNILLALPFRPVEGINQSMDTAFKLNTFVSLYHPAFFNSALGYQNIVNALKTFGDLKDLGDFSSGISQKIIDEWTAVAGSLEDELLKYIEEEVVPKEKERILSESVEFSHVLNRTGKYTAVDFGATAPEVTFSHEQFAATDFSTNADDNDNRMEARRQRGVPCMRYEVSIEKIEFTDDFMSKNKKLLGVNKNNERITIEWQAACLHSMFGDMLTVDAIPLTNGELSQGALVIRKHEKKLPFTGKRISAHHSMAHKVFAEWPTSDAPRNAVFGVKGKVFFRTSINMDLGNFSFNIGMDETVGLATSGKTTFTARGIRDDFEPAPFTITFRMTQLPFAEKFEKVEVSLQNYTLANLVASLGKDAPVKDGDVIRLEASLNGNVFETSRLIPVLGSETIVSELLGGAVLDIAEEFGSGWSQMLVYDKSDPLASFRLGINCEVMKSDLTLLRTLSIEKTFHRFSAGDPDQALELDEGALDTASIQAGIAGAGFEWGIPVDLPFAEFSSGTDDGAFNAVVRITKEYWKASRLMAKDTPKPVTVDFIRNLVIDNSEDASGGDIKFFPSVEIHQGSFVTPYALGETNTGNFEDNEEMLFKNVSKTVSGGVDRSFVRARCSGTEFDSFLNGGNDSMGTAVIDKNIVAADGPVTELTGDSSNGDGKFRLFTEMTSRALPPAPDLFFDNYPDKIDAKTGLTGGLVTFLYSTGWGDKHILQYSTDSGSTFKEVKIVSGGTGTAQHKPDVTTVYRLESINRESRDQGVHVYSRLLKVFITVPEA